MEAIKTRRSIRKYTDKAVSKEMIEDIVSAAILSPSAKNRQPWKFIVYTDTKKNEILDVMEQALVKEKETHAARPRKKLEDVLEFR